MSSSDKSSVLGAQTFIGHEGNTAAFLDALSDGAFVLGPDDVIVFANLAATQFLDLERAQIVDSKLGSLLQKHNGSPLSERCKTGSEQLVLLRHDPTGARVPLVLNVFDEQTLGSDCGQRVATLRAPLENLDCGVLGEPKSNYAHFDLFDIGLALEGPEQGIWEWNAQTNAFTTSKAWRKLFGYSVQEVREKLKNLIELAHPEEREMTRETLIRVLKGEQDLYHRQQRMRHKDGQYLHCLIRGRVTERDADGRAKRMIGTHTNITTLVETQEALEQSNARLNAALELAQQAVWEYIPSSDTFILHGEVHANGEHLRAEDVPSGQALLDITHPDYVDNISTALHECLHTTGNYEVEHCIQLNNGSFRTFFARGRVTERDAQGRAVHVLGALIDISELQSQHRRLEIALENGRQGMWEWRPDEDTITFSDSWFSLYGYTHDEIKNVRTDVSSRIHPDDIAHAKVALIGLIKGEQDDYTVEYRFRGKDGRYTWVMERSAVVERDPDGRASLVVGTHVDISTQKSAQTSLRNSRQFLRLIIDSLPELIYWKDKSSNYLGANRPFADAAGLDNPADAVGLNDYDFPWHATADDLRADDQLVMEGKPQADGVDELFTDSEGKERRTETTKLPLVNTLGETVGVLGISREVSKQRRYEKQMKTLAESITQNRYGRLLDSLARSAAELSSAKGSFIAKLDPTTDIATVVSTYPDNDAIMGITYDINDTPCSNAMVDDLCIFADKVQAAFPSDPSLSELNINGYIGKRLLDNEGRIIGLFVLYDSEPIEEPDYAASVLDVVSATAASELQREAREIALAESEHRYRTTYDNVPTMICSIDEDGTIIDANNAWLTSTGFDLEQVVGSKLVKFFSLDSAASYEAIRQRMMDHEQFPRGQQLELVRQDGSIVHVSYNAARTISDGVRLTISVFEDVTERISAEEQLRIAAAAFDTHEALVIRDANKRVLRINPAFKSISGFSDEEVIGQLPTHLQDDGADHEQDAAIWSSVDKFGKWDGERISYRADGTSYSVWHTITAVRDEQGLITHYIENFTDVSQLNEALAEARRLALFDPLTDLPNRRYLMEQLDSSIAQLRRNRTNGALLFIDLDQFKTINDSLGHNVGDVLLVQVAKRLKRLMRKEDMIARLGGDEFVVVLSELGANLERCVDQAHRVAEKIHTELGKTYEVDSHEFSVTPTIGITLFPDEGKTVEVILQEADSAMYQGKADGRNTTKFFHPSMQTEAQTRLSLERDLRTAAERGELELYFQPQFAANNRIIAAEALLRWQHPLRGEVPPNEFIPIAEDSGLILDISRWVFEQALNCLSRWAQQDQLFIDHLAINVSSRQFRSSNFVRDAIRALSYAGVPAERVVLEVTEGTVIEDISETVERMSKLRDLGVRFSVDDFGVGYSSLAYLSRLPLDQLKIDRSFVTNVLSDPSDAILAETIIGMGRNLNLQTIAEGVESQAQVDFLREKGCDAFQGYFFSQPLNESEFLALNPNAVLPNPLVSTC